MIDASAASALFIPGFDPQPITANLIGSQDSVTTYVIAPGVSSAGLDDAGIMGPGMSSHHLHHSRILTSMIIATLIVGPSTAAVTYIDENLGIALYENCNVADGVAVCEDVVIEMGSGGMTMTDTVTQPVESFAIQGGGVATGADAITTSPVPTGDFATWTADYDGLTFSDDSGVTANAGSTQSGAATATATATATGSVTTEATWSGFSKVSTPTSGASQSGSSSASTGAAQTTSQTGGAARFQTSSLITVVVTGLIGVLITLA